MGLLTIFLVYVVKLQSCHFVEKKNSTRPKIKVQRPDDLSESYNLFELQKFRAGSRGVCRG